MPPLPGQGSPKLAKTPIDELVRAIETISYLSGATAANEASIVAMEKRIDRIESVLHELIKVLDALNRGG